MKGKHSAGKRNVHEYSNKALMQIQYKIFNYIQTVIIDILLIT